MTLVNNMPRGVYKRGKKQLENMSRAKIGKKNPYWRGDKVKYSGLHKWADKYLLRPKRCSFCNKSPKKKQRVRIQWANKSGEYRRIESDWIALCVSCHKSRDLQIIRFKKTIEKI